MKINITKRWLSAVMAVLMLLAMLPSMGFAAETGADSTTVWFSVVDNIEMDFPVVRRQITVPAGTGTKYGWENAAPDHEVGGQNHGVNDGEVTAMDALLFAHEEIYGDAFNEESMADYIGGSASYVTKIFCRDAANGIGFAVNDRLPVGEMSDGYAANEYVLKDGDEVTWFLYGGDYWNDYYSYFDQRTVAAETGTPVTLSLNAFYAMESMMMTPGDATPELTTLGPVSGASIFLMDAESGAMLEPLGGDSPATTDENGRFTYTFETPGTYHLTADGTVAGMGLDNPIVPPYCKVTITEHTTSIDPNLSSSWPSFRGNDNNMAVVDAATPKDPDYTGLKWAKKLGSGWFAAPSVQIIVDDSLIVMSSTILYKLNLENGEITAQAEMSAKPDWGYTPPTYGEGLIFCPLAGGTVEAFRAKTLEKVWTYQSAAGQTENWQANSPITYTDGRIYIGFWNSEVAEADFVCLNAKTGAEEWSYSVPGGFYWAGSVAIGDYIAVGTDDGASDSSGNSNLLVFHKTYAEGETAEPVSTMDLTGCGDQRSSLAYAEDGRVYFTTKGGYLCSAALDAQTGEISELKKASFGYQGASTPVVYGNYVYFGIGRMGEGYFAIADKDTLEIVKKIEMLDYPQCSMLLSTAYLEEDGNLYFYSTYNTRPGGISLIKVKPDDPESAALTELYDAKGYEQYCISSIICDEDGNLYYKNDGGHVLAVEKKSEAAPKYSVSFRLIGSSVLSEEDYDNGIMVDLGEGVPDGYHGVTYQNWIQTKTYEVNIGTTADELLETALEDAGLAYNTDWGGYSISAPESFGGHELYQGVNGDNSDWMYMINGSHDAYFENMWYGSAELQDGDVLVWHFSNDYAYEIADDQETSGDETTWVDWNTVVADTDPNITVAAYDYNAAAAGSEGASEDGVVFEESIPLTEGLTAADAVKKAAEQAGVELTMNEGYVSAIGGLGAGEGMSGWCLNYNNDDFKNAGLNTLTLQYGDQINFHYSVNPDGKTDDIGNGWYGKPIISSLTLAERTVTMRKETTFGETGSATKYFIRGAQGGEKEMAGSGTETDPFIIPISLPAGTDLQSLEAEYDTELGEHYRKTTGLDGKQDYSEDHTVSLATLGGNTTYYTVKVTVESSGGGGGGSSDSRISVSFRLIGATKSSEDVNFGTGAGDSEYKNWIKTKTYKLDENATVYDLFTKALDDAGLSYEGAENNYVKSITAPSVYGGYKLSEFTNGPRSGWMYTRNGKHPDLGLREQKLKDGDKIVWHYVNDYAYEVKDWFDDPAYPGQGNEDTWVDWDKDIADSRLPSDSSSSSGGGSGSISTKYDIAIDSVTNGTVSASVKSAAKGSTVTLTAKADEGYKLDKLTVTDSDGKEVTLTDKGEGKYTFAMPASKVTVKAVFVEGSRETPDEKTFTDVPETHWAVSYIKDLTDKKILNGKSETEFAPEDNITRAEFAAILSRMSGDELPAADGTFTDVADDAWCAVNVAWAVKAGLTQGVSETEFAPNANITRQDMAVMIERYAAYKAYSFESKEETSIFADENEIAEYAKNAVSAMQKAGIISGMGDKTFAPLSFATRAQAAKMLSVLLGDMSK